MQRVVRALSEGTGRCVETMKLWYLKVGVLCEVPSQLDLIEELGDVKVCVCEMTF